MKYYVVEIVRDENGDITDRILRFATNKNRGGWGFESEIIADATDWNLATTRVAVDGNGDAFLEEDADAIALQASEDEIALRVKRIQFGQRLVAIMSIRNDAKSLTTEQIVQLVNDFADINKAWLNGSIATSRALVDALVPDETILTTADKTAILAEIDANLTALGY